MKVSPLLLLPLLGLALGFGLAWLLDPGPSGTLAPEPGSGSARAPAERGGGGAPLPDAAPGADPGDPAADPSRSGQADDRAAAVEAGPESGAPGRGLAPVARELEAGPLQRGFVADRDNGRPIAAELRLVLAEDQGERRASAPESGEFEIPWPEGLRGDLWVEAPGFVARCWPDLGHLPHSGLWLDPFGSLEVRCVDFGRRGDELWIELWRLDERALAGTPCRSVRVPADQPALFRDLEPGVYLVSASGPLVEAPGPSFPPRALRSGVRVEPRGEARLELGAPQGLRPSFEIEAPPTPDLSAWLELWPLLQGPAASLARAPLIVPLVESGNTARGRIFAGGWPADLPARFAAVACTSTGQRRVFLPRPDARGQVPLETLPPLARLRLDIRDPLGRPLAGARVGIVPVERAGDLGPWSVPDQDRLQAQLEPAPLRGSSVHRSDTGGRLLAEVPSGMQLLLAVWPAEHEQVLAGLLGPEAISAAELVLLEPIAPGAWREMELELRPGEPLDILALDADGAPAAGALLELYRLPRRSGDLRFGAHPLGPLAALLPEPPTAEQQPPASDVPAICELGAQILPPLRLELDAEGRALVDSAAPGQLWLRATLPGHLPLSLVLPGLDDRREQRPQRLRLDFERAAELEGQVVDELGAGIEGARVEWRDLTGITEVRCGPSGRFRLTGLRPERGWLRANALGHTAGLLATQAWTAGQGGRVRLVLERSPWPRFGSLRASLRTLGTTAPPLPARCEGAGPFATVSAEGSEHVISGIDLEAKRVHFAAPWHLPAKVPEDRLGIEAELHLDALPLEPLMRLTLSTPDAAWLERLRLEELSDSEAELWRERLARGESSPEDPEAEQGGESDLQAAQGIALGPDPATASETPGQLEALGSRGTVFVRRRPYLLTLGTLPAPLLLSLDRLATRYSLPPGLELLIQP